MTPVSLILAVLLADEIEPAFPLRLVTALAAERIPLPASIGPVEIVIDHLAATVELRTSRPQPSLAAKIIALKGNICPTVTTMGAVLVMRCRTGRIHAEMHEEKGQRYFDLQELRGLPWRGEAQQLKIFYDPHQLGFGEGCPGSTPAGRGECAFQAGRKSEAAIQFRLALDTGEKSLAAVRLGDLALEVGDVTTAIGWYQRAGTIGPFGRLAAARLCELSGDCLTRPRPLIFDPTGLPDMLRAELMLRAARVAAFAGRSLETTKLISGILADYGSIGVCRTIVPLYCRRLMLYTLEETEGEEALEAIETYLDLPDRRQGVLNYDLLRAAADKAAEIGAPVFGGNLLAAAGASIDLVEIPSHLLRTAELYLLGGDRPRARLIFEYAETRVGRNRMGGPRWGAIRAEIGTGREAEDDASKASRYEQLAKDSAGDVAAADAVMTRVRRER